MTRTGKSKWTENLPGTKYSRRAERERGFQDKPLSKLKTVLSGNKKTGASLNLPLLNCRPSKLCAETCYAMEGYVAQDMSIRHTQAVDAMLRTGLGIAQLTKECQARDDVRLCGIGDLVEDHLPQLFRLAEDCPATIFWGFTRKREIADWVRAKRLSNLTLILSWDHTHPPEHVAGYAGPLSYGPTRPGDEVPDDPRIIVVFPEHHQKDPHPDTAITSKDCPAIRYGDEKQDACQRCRRCIDPNNFDPAKLPDYEAKPPRTSSKKRLPKGRKETEYWEHPDADFTTTGQRIRECRAEKKGTGWGGVMSQRELAEELSIPVPSISGWESGRVSPPMPALEHMAVYTFKVSVAWLDAGIGDKHTEFKPEDTEIVEPKADPIAPHPTLRRAVQRAVALLVELAIEDEVSPEMLEIAIASEYAKIISDERKAAS